MPHPKIKISDDSGNTVNVSDIGGTKALDVNILGATIDAGDLEINSEFPAAAAITDNFANPETTSVMSMLMGYDGGNWDRLVIGGGTEAAALRVTLASDSTGVITVDGSVTVNTISGFATSGNQLAAGHTVDCDDSDVNVTNIADAKITGFATSGNQLAAGHTIDCNASYVKIKADDGTAITDGTNSGMLDVSIHASDGSAFTDTAGKMNVQVGNDVGNPVYIESNITGMTHGINDDVDTTAEQLDGSTSGLDTACKRVDLMAAAGNTGDIYVGSTDAIAGDGSVGGIRLQAGDFYSIDINNLNDIWVEASIVDQALNYIYYT